MSSLHFRRAPFLAIEAARPRRDRCTLLSEELPLGNAEVVGEGSGELLGRGRHAVEDTTDVEL